MKTSTMIKDIKTKQDARDKKNKHLGVENDI